MRNASGEGSYETLPFGRCRYTLKVAGVVYRNTCADRKAARREVAAIHETLAAGGQDTLGSVTLEQWGARWLAGRTNRNAEDEARRWHRHVAGTALAQLPVAEISRRDVRQ